MSTDGFQAFVLYLVLVCWGVYYIEFEDSPPGVTHDAELEDADQTVAVNDDHPSKVGIDDESMDPREREWRILMAKKIRAAAAA